MGRFFMENNFHSKQIDSCLFATKMFLFYAWHIANVFRRLHFCCCCCKSPCVPEDWFDLSFKPCGAYKRAAFIWDSTLIRGNTVYKLNLKQNVLILCKTLDWSLCLLNLNLSSNSRLNIFRVTTLISGPC